HTELAKQMGYTVTWGDWAIAASVPGVVSLLVIPYVLYLLYPPAIRETPNAPLLAREALREMGKTSRSEWMMMLALVVLLGLWIAGPYIGISAALAALVGLCILLVTGT